MTDQMPATELIIRERAGTVNLRLVGASLRVSPCKGLFHTVAGRIQPATPRPTAVDEIIDQFKAKTRRATGGGLERVFGEFPVAECNLIIEGSRLRVRLRRFQVSFGPETFSLPLAEEFVREFERAKACLVQ